MKCWLSCSEFFTYIPKNKDITQLLVLCLHAKSGSRPLCYMLQGSLSWDSAQSPHRGWGYDSMCTRQGTGTHHSHDNIPFSLKISPLAAFTEKVCESSSDGETWAPWTRDEQDNKTCETEANKDKDKQEEQKEDSSSLILFLQVNKNPTSRHFMNQIHRWIAKKGAMMQCVQQMLIYWDTLTHMY